MRIDGLFILQTFSLSKFIIHGSPRLRFARTLPKCRIVASQATGPNGVWSGFWLESVVHTSHTIKNTAVLSTVRKSLTRRWMLVAWLCIASAAHAGPQKPLALCYEDVPQFPWTNPDGTGLNFELLKRVEKQLGEQFRYEVKPWKRCIEEVRAGVMDGVIGAADSPERRSFGAVATLPNGQIDHRAALYEESYRIFTRVGSAAAWDGHTLRTPDGAVLVQSGYQIAELLRQRGFKPVESARSAEDGLRMLAAGSYDVAALYGTEAEAMARADPRFTGKIVQAPTTYSDWSMYLLISRKTFEADKKRIHAIWRAIRTVRESEEYRKLESATRHGTPPPKTPTNNDN